MSICVLLLLKGVSQIMYGREGRRQQTRDAGRGAEEVEI